MNSYKKLLVNLKANIRNILPISIKLFAERLRSIPNYLKWKKTKNNNRGRRRKQRRRRRRTKRRIIIFTSKCGKKFHKLKSLGCEIFLIKKKTENEKNWSDNLRVNIKTDEFEDFLNQ